MIFKNLAKSNGYTPIEELGENLYNCTLLAKSSYFNKFKKDLSFLFTPFIKNKVHAISLPGYERGVRDVIDGIYPQYKGSVNEIPVTHELIQAEDDRVISLHCRKKHISFNMLDLSILKKTLGYIYKLTIINSFNLFQLISVKEAFEILPSGTSSCVPLFLNKGDPKVIKQVSEEVVKFDGLSNMAERVSMLKHLPVIIYHRITTKLKWKRIKYLTDRKVRQVFGFPALISVLEVRYFRPFVLAFKSGMEDFLTVGLTKSEVSQKVADVRLTAARSNRGILCGDISGCDTSITPDVYYYMFSMWQSVLPSQYWSAFLSVCSYVIWTPVASTRNKIDLTYGGNPSGSWITTYINTFAVSLACFYGFYAINGRFPVKGEFLVQGDDFIIVVNDKSELFHYKAVLKIFNLRLKVTDTPVVSGLQDILFLGFFWNAVGEPHQTSEWIVGRTLFPEKFVELAGPDRVISRYLSLIFQLGDYLELFKLFYKHDKYLRMKMINNPNPTFSIIDSRGNVHKTIVPIQRYLNVGWKLF